MKALVTSFALAGMLATSSLCVPALAADMPLKAPPPAPVVQPSWTGFYIGGEVGYGWSGDNNATFAPNDPPAARLLNGTIGFVGEQPVVGSVPVSRKGAVGGFEAGYNWQIGAWVWGLETDINFAHLSGQGSGTSVVQGPPAATFMQSVNGGQGTDWYGTFRGRLGWLWTPNLLLFGTGGLAYGHTSEAANYGFTGPLPGNILVNLNGFSFACAANATCFQGANSATKVGWTAGGGAEWLIYRNWSVKAEYQFVDLGTQTVRASAGVLAVPGTALSSFNAVFRDEIHVVRAGINYHF